MDPNDRRNTLALSRAGVEWTIKILSVTTNYPSQTYEDIDLVTNLLGRLKSITHEINKSDHFKFLFTDTELELLIRILGCAINTNPDLVATARTLLYRINSEIRPATAKPVPKEEEKFSLPVGLGGAALAPDGFTITNPDDIHVMLPMSEYGLAIVKEVFKIALALPYFSVAKRGIAQIIDRLNNLPRYKPEESNASLATKVLELEGKLSEAQKGTCIACQRIIVDLENRLKALTDNAAKEKEIAKLSGELVAKDRQIGQQAYAIKGYKENNEKLTRTCNEYSQVLHDRSREITRLTVQLEDKWGSVTIGSGGGGSASSVASGSNGGGGYGHYNCKCAITPGTNGKITIGDGGPEFTEKEPKQTIFYRFTKWFAREFG